jgi:hypothetical protein
VIQVAKQIGAAAQIGGFGSRNRLVTEWVPLVKKNAMPFYSVLVSAELSLQSRLGNFPW